jgi:hypothetical protein
MAKAKKLTKKEHETLKDRLESVNRTKSAFILAASSYAESKTAFEKAHEEQIAAQVGINEMQQKLIEKYGMVNINVESGELVEIESEGDTLPQD